MIVMNRTPERTLTEDALIQANGILVTIEFDYRAAGRTYEADRIKAKIELIQAALHHIKREGG
jgi:hypothetical protein